MYVDSVTNVVIYETFEDLLDADIDFISENEQNYYIRIKSKAFYDDNMWAVDKKTNKVSFIGYINYMLNIMDNTKPVDPETLKRAG